jgi:PAS domain S-box-containing protein
MKLSTSQLINLAFGTAAVVLSIVSILAFYLASNFAKTVVTRRQVYDRLTRLNSFMSLLRDAETSQRGFLLTNDPDDLRPYYNATTKWKDEFLALERAFSGPPRYDEQIQRLRSLSEQHLQRLAELNTIREELAAPTLEQLQSTVRETNKHAVMEQLRSVANELELAEQDRLARLYSHSEGKHWRTVGGAGVLCFLTFAFIAGTVWRLHRDIRLRTAAEAELRRQREQQDAILRSMNEGVIVAAEDGRMTMFNPAAEELMGKGPMRGDPREWTEHYGVYMADGVTPYSAEQLPLVRAVMQGETVEFDEMMLRFKNGEVRWLAGVASPIIDDSGVRRGGVVVFRDFTARRIAERRFQSLLESAPDALVIADPSGVIRLVNAEAERMFGYTREQLVGQHVEMLLPEEKRLQHPSLRDAYFADPRVRAIGSGLELYGQRADGSRFPIEISLAPVEGVDGIQVCAAIRDVTERRRVLEQIRQLNDELEDRVTARTQELAEINAELVQRNQENELFVYSVSHDLRSPLVNLQGFSQELEGACERLRAVATQDDVAPHIRELFESIVACDVTESIHFIRTSVARLSGIIDALLRLSRAGRVVYQWQVVDVASIVQRVVDAAKGTVDKRHATVEIGELPPVWGDYTAIEQVFANLIHNALNYLTPDREALVAIGSMPGENAQLTYFVRDTGIGIAAELQPKIFQPFQRLNPRYAPGEGMGLTLAQRIVERHGGRIWVESTPNVGSTFFFTLPGVQREQKHVPATESAGERL